MLTSMFRSAPIAALLTGASIFIGPTTSAYAQSRYDGSWSVLIVTDRGDCDQAYRFGVQIQGGRIFYDGSGATTQGRVSGNGQVTVTVRQGDSYATGSGRLSGISGGGSWSGASATSRCSGRWRADRR